jgi:uncharacterized protein (TIGR02996 family)
MTEAELLRAIAADLYDDAPRLVYADWLEQKGETERAELIRVQCELEPVRHRYELERAAALHAREDELLAERYEEHELPEALRGRELGAELSWARGLPDTASMPARTFLQHGEQLRELYPTLRRLVLFRVQGQGQALAACPWLQGWPELELACWYSDKDARAIAASPWLGSLQVLEIWLARRARGGDSRLCKIMGGGQAWPQLRRLVLLDPEGDLPERLVGVADKAAGRALAVKVRGYPELFPFAADFWDAYPGRLPDGRMAMASEDATTSPPTLGVLTFDEHGEQTDEVLRVPLPEELLSVEPGQWYKHKDRIRQHLREVLGLVPAFIRIGGCEFPWDKFGGLAADRGFGEEWDQLGLPDEDEGEDLEDDPRGIGGKLTWVIRTGQYCFGPEGWADQRGRVHTT